MRGLVEIVYLLAIMSYGHHSKQERTTAYFTKKLDKERAKHSKGEVEC